MDRGGSPILARRSPRFCPQLWPEARLCLDEPKPTIGHSSGSSFRSDRIHWSDKKPRRELPRAGGVVPPRLGRYRFDNVSGTRAGAARHVRRGGPTGISESVGRSRPTNSRCLSPRLPFQRPRRRRASRSPDRDHRLRTPPGGGFQDDDPLPQTGQGCRRADAAHVTLGGRALRARAPPWLAFDRVMRNRP